MDLAIRMGMEGRHEVVVAVAACVGHGLVPVRVVLGMSRWVCVGHGVSIRLLSGVFDVVSVDVQVRDVDSAVDVVGSTGLTTAGLERCVDTLTNLVVDMTVLLWS